MKTGAILVFTQRFDEMVTFYRDVLGLPIKGADPGEGYRVGVDFMDFDTGETFLEIFDEQVHAGQLGDIGRMQGRVVTALGVDDLKAWLAAIDGKVEVLTDVRQADWGSFVYILDADGNPFQIYQEA